MTSAGAGPPPPWDPPGAQASRGDPPGALVGPVFVALADPTRRQVVRLLAEGGSATATELAGQLPMTRQGVAKHLGALGRAGLVVGDRQGRETRYRLTPAPLAEASSWMADVGAAWDWRLAALRRHLGRSGEEPG
ncbi:MAG: ArsR/SmtB family transcription factor [Acidimicrobiales bacterium]